MKKSRFTEAQIIKVLKEQESGIPVKDIARKYEISEGTFYNWKSKYGGMSLNELKRIKELEEENRRLKKLYADLSLEHDILKDVLENPVRDPYGKSPGARGKTGSSELRNRNLWSKYSPGI